ncbi:hypothetical protein [Pantoea sp. SGAir0215]
MDNPKVWMEFVSKLNSMNLSSSAYILIAFLSLITSIIGGYYGAYFKEKAKIDTITSNFDKLKTQLEENTQATKRIESSFNEKLWISQQVWQKKYEIYENIFRELSNIKKWVDHEAENIDLHLEPQYLQGILDSGLNEIHEKQLLRDIKKAQIALKEKTNSSEFIKKREEYTNLLSKSIETLTDMLIIKSFILNDKVVKILESLPEKLDFEIEDWPGLEDYQDQIITATNGALREIKQCAIIELQLHGKTLP